MASIDATTTRGDSIIAAHLKRHRFLLAASYIAAMTSNVLELLYPFAIGLAMDGLLSDSWNGVIAFASVALLHTGLAVARQLYDTRIFNQLYANLATDLVEQQRAEGVTTTSLVARTGLAAEYVDFLLSAVHAAITSAFAVIGSLLMLWFYDSLLGLVATLVAVPAVLLNRGVLRRSRPVYRRLNDRAELEVSIIEAGSASEVRHHFGVIAGHWNRLSDVEATSWGLVEVLGLGLAVFALVRTTETAGEAGTIFAVITYVWAYMGGFDQVPAVLQRMSNLSDIRRRLDGLSSTDREPEPTSPSES